MSNYYKKTTVVSRRTTTVTLKGGGTMSQTSLMVILKEMGMDINPTWREDATRNLPPKDVLAANEEMARLVGQADFLRGIIDVRA